MSTISVQIANLETRFTRALMVNCWTRWLAEWCQSMEHFEFIQCLLSGYSNFARESIIYSPHIFLTLRSQFLDRDESSWMHSLGLYQLLCWYLHLLTACCQWIP